MVEVGKKEGSNIPLFFGLLAGAFVLGILLFNLRGGQSANPNANAGAVQAAQPVAPHAHPMTPIQPTVYPEHMQHPQQMQHPQHMQQMPAMHPVHPSLWQPGHQLYAVPAPGGVRLKTVVDR